MSRAHTLIKGTLILTMTGLTTRMMGFFYRIFLSHAFGEEGVGLYVAGLMAEGTTEIFNVEHIDRGYEEIGPKLCALGARIWRENITPEEAEILKQS